MRECRVCGLLYLMADRCPSCGSPDHLDMDADGQGQLVTAQRGGIPGLGDAERTMADLLGEDEPLTSPAGQGDRRSSLPFGMGGVLATPRTSLPFGVGSIGSAVDLPRTALSGVLAEQDMAQAEPRAPAPKEVHQTALRTKQMAPDPSLSLESELDRVPLPAREVAEVDRIPLPDEHESTTDTDISVSTPGEAPTSTKVLPDTNERRTVEIDVVSEVKVPEPKRTMTPESSMEADVAIEGPAWTPLVATEPASDAPEDLLSIMSGPTQVEEATFDPRIADVMAAEPTLHPGRALAIDGMSSSDQVALVRRGFEAMAEEAWEMAAREFATLRPLRPEDAAVITNLGLARLQHALSTRVLGSFEDFDGSDGRFDEAIRDLRDAARLDPSNGSILFNLAQALLLSGRVDKAMLVLERTGLGSGSDDPEVHNLIGACAVASGRSSEARSSYEMGLSLNPGDPIIQENLRLLGN